MKCDCGHIMIPLCEYDPDENGDYYVVFRCVSCGKTNTMDYQEYVMSRQSCTCPLCGKKFWGSTLENCNRCGIELPRVPKKSWSSVQIGSDDIFIDGWSDDPAGHYYTPEELKASGVLPGFIKTSFRSGHTAMLKSWLESDSHNMNLLIDCLLPDNNSVPAKETADAFSAEDILEALFRSDEPQNNDRAEKPSHAGKSRWWRRKS